jgi:hypothetical protein
MIQLKTIWVFRSAIFILMSSVILVPPLLPYRYYSNNLVDIILVSLLLLNLALEAWFFFKTKKARVTYRLIQKFQTYSEDEINNLLKNNGYSSDDAVLAWRFFNQRFFFKPSMLLILVLSLSVLFLGWAISEIIPIVVVSLLYVFFLIFIFWLQSKSLNSLDWLAFITTFLVAFFLLIDSDVLWFSLFIYPFVFLITSVLFFKQKSANFFLIHMRLLISTVVGFAIGVALYIAASFLIGYLSSFFMYSVLVYILVYLTLLVAYRTYKYVSKT